MLWRVMETRKDAWKGGGKGEVKSEGYNWKLVEEKYGLDCMQEQREKLPKNMA